MFHTFLIFCACVFAISSILPADNLYIFIRLRKQLYISLNEGRAVLNNAILDENSIDAVLPVSIRKIDKLYYGILVDSSPICSFGLFKDVAECVAAPEGKDTWILQGSEDDFTIEGSGGCITRYEPKTINTDFKHGLRIEFCNGGDDQRFMIQKIPYNLF